MGIWQWFQGFDGVEQFLYATAFISTIWFAAALIAKAKKEHWFREYGEALFVAVWLALGIRATLVEVYSIPSESMVPTLLIKDHLVVSKLSYGWHLPFTKGRVLQFKKPKRGDIVIFVPPNDEQKTFVKRCLGVPGDLIEIRCKKLFVGGKPAELETSYGELKSLAPSGEKAIRPLFEAYGSRRSLELQQLKTKSGQEAFLREAQKREWLGPLSTTAGTYNVDASPFNVRVYARLADIPSAGELNCLPPRMDEPKIWGGKGNRDNFGPYQLKPGEYWMQGDNRDNSSDSRYFGPVPEENLRGTPLLRYWPMDRMGLVR